MPKNSALHVSLKKLRVFVQSLGTTKCGLPGGGEFDLCEKGFARGFRGGKSHFDRRITAGWYFAADNCLFLNEQASLVDMTTNSKTIKSLLVFCLLSQATILCEMVLLCVPSQTSLQVSDSLRTESHQKSWISKSKRETELLLGFFPL